MKSKVYFISVTDADSKETIREKFSRLVGESAILDFISKGDKVALKMHFGEEGNTGYVRPECVKVVSSEVLKKQASPVITDTNTLYSGRRGSAAEHLKLAHEHGFTLETAGAPVAIADDSDKGANGDINLNAKYIRTAHIAPLFLKQNAIVGIAHFKGHIMAGFGGALKNIGMGCASRKGKLAQHSDVSPLVYSEACIGCGECVKLCPANAINISAGKARILAAKCIGCATCIAVCPKHAMGIDWEGGADNIQQKMMEYAKAALIGVRAKAAFFNFAIKITKECDCLAKDDPKIVPDVGIFASRDPVSIDKASVDLVNSSCGRDIFRQVHPDRDWKKQLDYASSIGLGSLDYETIHIKTS